MSKHETTEAIINRAAQALLGAAPSGSRVILFGSHARGLAHPDSDLDFLVVEPKVNDRFYEIVRLRRAVDKALDNIVQPVDLVVMDSERFVQKSAVPNTIAHEAATYGRVYE